MRLPATTRGIFTLVFLAGGSRRFAEFICPSSTQAAKAQAIQLVSRDALLLVNNILLVSAAATILLGTIYPLDVVHALGAGKIVGRPAVF
jgi:cytochrome c-type biogenesis protein CcmF